MAFRGGVNHLLWWPALSFGVVSIAYLTNDVRWFGKRRDGSRHYLATGVLFPYLMFVHGVWRLQIALSHEPAINYVNSSLAVSRRLLAHELPEDITRVCDLTCEFRDPKHIRTKLRYECHPILDAGACTAAELIDLARKLSPSNEEILLIHCANGHGRTGMFAAVWLLTHGLVTSVDDAITMLQAVRPGIGLRPRQRRLVMEAMSALQNSAEAPDLAESANRPLC